jgi:hypothetical protein
LSLISPTPPLCFCGVRRRGPCANPWPPNSGADLPGVPVPSSCARSVPDADHILGDFALSAGAAAARSVLQAFGAAGDGAHAVKMMNDAGAAPGAPLFPDAVLTAPPMKVVFTVGKKRCRDRLRTETGARRRRPWTTRRHTGRIHHAVARRIPDRTGVRARALRFSGAALFLAGDAQGGGQDLTSLRPPTLHTVTHPLQPTSMMLSYGLIISWISSRGFRSAIIMIHLIDSFPWPVAWEQGLPLKRPFIRARILAKGSDALSSFILGLSGWGPVPWPVRSFRWRFRRTAVPGPRTDCTFRPVRSPCRSLSGFVSHIRLCGGF